MPNQTAIFFVRAALGVCFLMHGLQKVLPYSWLAGPTHRAYARHLSSGSVPWADFAAHVIPWAEVAAGAALLIGFAHKASCSTIIVLMVCSILFFHRSSYFGPKGMEYSLALIAMSLLIYSTGPGAFAFKINVKANRP